METYQPQIGTPIEDLDTPCLLVDVDALEHNFGLVAETYRDAHCKMREHAKNIKSPVVAHMQIRAGGTMGGVCTAKVSEAEVMVAGGINDILVTSQIPTRDKLDRLAALAKRADIKVVVDDKRNLQNLSDSAQSIDATVGVLIEVDTSMSRGGIRRVEEGVELARQAVKSPGIVFRGVMSHQSLAGHPDKETRIIEGRRYIQMCLDVKDAVEAAGIPVEIVSTGETWTYDVAADMPGVTEVEGGTYAFMDTSYDHVDHFDYAAILLGSIISTPRPGIAIGDLGTRALAAPRGTMPSVVDMPGVTVQELHEDHIVLRVEEPASLELGEHFQLHSGQQDIMVNRWDQIIAVRGGVVDGIYEVLARGCHN